jgi:hypothetical protein
MAPGTSCGGGGESEASDTFSESSDLSVAGAASKSRPWPEGLVSRGQVEEHILRGQAACRRPPTVLNGP